MYEQIAKNKRRTFLLLFFFVALIAAAALAFNFLLGFGAIGVVVAIVFAIAMAWGSYFYSDRVALAASRAKPAGAAIVSKSKSPAGSSNPTSAASRGRRRAPSASFAISATRCLSSFPPITSNRSISGKSTAAAAAARSR